ncbi:MAG: hypothetical protein QOK39_114 [Acidimicrobiaceae bacterium]|jgi:hypothetical protein|nr:hypothetical protein [Acidimicrobiaceae bacterium]
MAGQIIGLAELRRELRATPDASVREVTRAIKGGAAKLTARAVGYVPAGGTGEMAATGRAFATAKRGGVKFTHPGAGVEEFATHYTRRGRDGGQHGVTITKGPTPPRFAYRALNELSDALVTDAFEALVEILKLHGWFVG